MYSILSKDVRRHGKIWRNWAECQKVTKQNNNSNNNNNNNTEQKTNKQINKQKQKQKQNQTTKQTKTEQNLNGWYFISFPIFWFLSVLTSIS